MNTEVIQNRYIHDLSSWMQFNSRVLFEAKRETNPILERFAFIGIADNNIDEFIRTKFSLEKKMRKAIIRQTNELETIYDCLINELRDTYGINICSIESLRHNKKVYKCLKTEFKKNIFPTLQPLVLKNELPIPAIQDGGTFMVSKLENEDARGISCIIKLNDPKLIKVKGVEGFKQTWVFQDDLIAEFINMFYRRAKVVWSKPFRVFRKIDSLYIDTNENYLGGIKDELSKRAKAEILMVDVESDIDGLQTIVGGAKKRKRRHVAGLSFLQDIKEIISYTDDMAYEKAKPRTPISLIGNNMFDMISDGDVLVHFPYESFELSTARFLAEAASDPNVIAIKQTLYRVSKNSQITKSLIRAAKSGKQVVVLLELKAKMDEWNNLYWAEELKAAGCDIIFGPIDMKTHGKVTLVIRKEGEQLAKYLNISTGNFNDKTAKSYEDLSYFTKERKRFKIGDDVCEIFNYLGGYSPSLKTNELVVSPSGFRPTFISEIDECIKSGLGARIIMKMNSLTDKAMVEKLYEASNAGVQIDLIVRGMCILIPGVSEMSENIRVRSIIGRYLEHSRIYRFIYNNDKPNDRIYMGSGDLMPRNLDRRVEILLPVKHGGIKSYLSELLDNYLLDTTNSHLLQPDESYIEPVIPITDTSFSVQNYLIKKYKKIEKSIIR